MKEITFANLELGQIMFGNPVGEYGCPEFVEALISKIFDEIERVYWNNNQEHWEKYENPGLKGIEFRSYYWGENKKEASKPNFAFNGVELRWYKYFGRSMSLNCLKTEKQWKKWFEKCLEHIRKQEKNNYA